MASLTETTRILGNITRQSDAPRYLDWPSDQLKEYLWTCPTTYDTTCWHRSWMEKILEIQDNSLERLCHSIATYILLATKKLDKLRLYPADGLIDRQAVLSSLRDITSAFQQFSIVNTNDDLGRPQTRDIVLAYLRKTYDLMIKIRWVLEPCEDDHDWLMENRLYLHGTQLQDFKFDSATDYHAQGELLPWDEVIAPHAEMPPSCRPAFPEVAVLTVAHGPYGRRVMPNERRVQGYIHYLPAYRY